MADTPSIGSLAKFAVDTVLPFDTSSQAFELILPESLKKQETFRETGGMRGTRSRHQSRVRRETERVGGNIQFHPGASELDWFLPYILGGATGAGVTALAETIPAFYALIDRIAKVHTYNAVKVNMMKLTGAMGAPVALSLDLEGQSETIGNAGTFPAIVIPDEHQFIFPDAAVTIDSVEYPMKRFELTLNNFLDSGRYMNATTRSSIPATDREVGLSLTLGYTPDTVALYDLAIAGVTGSLVLADGTDTYTIDFANLKAPTDSPVVSSKSEIDYTINFTARRTDDDAELLVTKT